jgi:hypothetical protein
MIWVPQSLQRAGQGFAGACRQTLVSRARSVTLRMVKRTAIMHVHQQPLPLVEVALVPDLNESCLVIPALDQAENSCTA